MLYRLSNTHDAMLGYKTQELIYIGFLPAKIDDILNYIPSRISSIFIVISSFILGFNYKNSFHILMRDSTKCPSPNSGFTMAPTAGALIGVIDTVIVFSLGLLYFNWQIRKYKAKGIGFDPNGTINMASGNITRDDCPNAFKAFLPIVSLVGIYLALYNGTFGIQMGSFPAVSTAMFIATVIVLVLNPGKFKDNTKAIVDATNQWTAPLFNFTCMIAFGAVVEATPGFASIADLLIKVPGGVYASAWLTTNAMCGITGSGSGGEVIALNSMANKWLAAGANPAVLARIVAISAVGFDSLPHCGGTTTSFGLCNEKVGAYSICCFFVLCNPDNDWHLLIIL